MPIKGQRVGFVFVFANAELFALYVVLGHRLAQRKYMGGVDGLAASMLAGAERRSSDDPLPRVSADQSHHDSEVDGGIVRP